MSNYKRKTEDEFQIHGYFPGTGWEEVTAEVTRKAALANLKEYRENDPSHSYKLIKKRVKKQIPLVTTKMDGANTVAEFG